MIEQIGIDSKKSTYELASLGTLEKNKALLRVSSELIMREHEILAANQLDIDEAIKNGVKQTLIDRLMLNHDRILGMTEGIKQIVVLEDPLGEVINSKRRPNGLVIGQKRVPIGVIGFIYEARPNVTIDAFALCFKAGNAVILKGSSMALNSNMKLVEVIQTALKSADISPFVVQLITNTDREATIELMRMTKYVDLIIPRGGASLIKTTIENSLVPVIETGTGNNHIFVDSSADHNMAIDIIINAKVQRPSVCNACEKVLIHKDLSEEFVPKLIDALKANNVEVRGDQAVCDISSDVILATDEDWTTEYSDYIIAIKIVSNIKEAIHHINEYNTRHSEAIITSDYANSNLFMDEVDAAAVYVNASTRFTDGGEFGFGAEVGISTQKLHARGPLGLKELTTTKYIIYGNGQIRQ
ncbi:MAG: glutamate-5-semialdehyde dehydrogenase [Clostridiales bacterium]|jgi:glutamate-5-semialdehyde dehydrogenase|nr:glutamate-5-semialdehyde dehydrogenase [Clostridiales bacterium]